MRINKFGFYCLTIMSSIFFMSCVAYNNLQRYTPSPGEHIINNLTVWYRVVPTTKIRSIPLLWYSFVDKAPYFFEIKVFIFSDKPETDKSSITIESVILAKGEKRLELLNEPVFLNIEPDKKWNETYSRRQSRYKFGSTYKCPRELPVDFQSDKEFDIVIELSLSQNERQSIYIHYNHYEKHQSKGMDWYINSMMSI